MISVTALRHGGLMDTATVVEHVQRVAAVRADGAALVADVEAALRSIGKLQSWLVSSRTALTSVLSDHVSFPEKTASECTRGSTRDAITDQERSKTLDSVPGFGKALDEGDITSGHVDVLTTTAKNLDNHEQRGELFDRAAGLVDVASVATLDEWRRRLGIEAKNIRRADGLDRLARQRRDTRLRMWTDGEGMVCINGRFDPVTGRGIVGRLDNAVAVLFTQATPDTCPTDPVARQHHLNALALARLIEGTAPATVGRPEYVVVIDASVGDGAGGPLVDWGIPIEVPHTVLADMMSDGIVHPVVVRNGVVIHAPGEANLGRSTRLANRAQRRALRAMYATCSIPGCSVGFDRCKIHHIVWWRNGGRTDLANLLPVCSIHHSKIHDNGWELSLGRNRELNVRFPDGTILTTGPPQRNAA